MGFMYKTPFDNILIFELWPQNNYSCYGHNIQWMCWRAVSVFGNTAAVSASVFGGGHPHGSSGRGGTLY